MRKVVYIAGVAAVAAGSIELVSSDLAGSNRGLDNIKGKWSQGLKFMGRDATLSAKYDRNENENFLSEASLNGALGKVKYQLTSRFGSQLDATLETTTSDGTTLEVEGSIDNLATKVSKVSASRAGMSVRGQTYDLEVSHSVADSESKLKASTVLGSGFTAVGHITNKAGNSNVAYEVEYDTSLSARRNLRATVSPAAGTGELEYEDSETLDGTLTASVPLGGAPKVTFSRSFNF